MGNCALKPKFLSEARAPAPEELKDSLLEDQKCDAEKSLSNLFRQAKAENKTKKDEKITPEKMPVIEDLNTALADATKEAKSPATETDTLVTEAKSLLTETKAHADDQKVGIEEAVCDKKVIDDATLKETDTEAKPEEIGREAAQ